MTVAPGRQGLMLLAAAGTGAFLAILYDLGRILRRVRRGTTWAVDGMFGGIYFLALWLTSYFGRGLRIYQLLGLLGGAAAWFLTGSGGFVSLGERGLRRALRPARRGMKFLRKTAKKLFSSRGKWGTIKEVPCPPGEEARP